MQTVHNKLNVCFGLLHGTISVTYALGLQGLLCEMRKGLFERKMYHSEKSKYFFPGKEEDTYLVLIEKVLST